MPFVAIPDVPPITRHVDEFVLGERPVSGSEDFWKDQLHTEFQKLISKRPFEMSSSERAMWQMLSDRIDIAQYRNIHLVKLRQLGRVEDARPGHNRIAWENGDSHRVRLDEMPAEFASTSQANRLRQSWFIIHGRCGS